VAAETRVDNQLLLVVRLRELEQQDLGGEVVDICEPQADEALGELVGDDLGRASARPMLTDCRSGTGSHLDV
jgi:hypothetical protein